MLRICRKKDIKSTIKYSNNGCTRQAANPQYIAENILNREFTADMPNEKWLTDVTEFKYYVGPVVHKIYLSAILDLYDRRIVSFVIRDSNNNALVFDTFDEAIEKNPNAHPLCHSDRGYQYTNRSFHNKLEKAGMTQSMSRVGKCIDNGPMEGFWGILKRERYYGKRFTDKETLTKMIEDYIDYYNNKRLQRNLGILTPMEKHEIYLQAAQKLPADNLLAGKIYIFSLVYLTGSGSEFSFSLKRQLQFTNQIILYASDVFFNFVIKFKKNSGSFRIFSLSSFPIHITSRNLQS